MSKAVRVGLVLVILGACGWIVFGSQGCRDTGEAIDNVADQVTGAGAVRAAPEVRDSIKQSTNRHEQDIKNHLPR